MNNELVKRLMKDQEVNQKSISDALGVDPSTTSQWLAGRKNPSEDNLAGLAALLGVTPDEIRDEPAREQAEPKSEAVLAAEEEKRLIQIDNEKIELLIKQAELRKRLAAIAPEGDDKSNSATGLFSFAVRKVSIGGGRAKK